MLMDLIAFYGLNVVNCSDGALISGATPRVPEAVEVNGLVIDRGAVMAEIEQSMVHYSSGQLVPTEALADLRNKSRAMFVALRGVFAGFDLDDADFPGVYNALREFLGKAEGSYAHVDTIVDGSLNALARIAMFYGCRTEGDRCRQLFSTFLHEIGKALTKMEAGTGALFDRLALLVAEDAVATVG
jgi:hypothetical protein